MDLVLVITVDESPGISDNHLESDENECRTSGNIEHFLLEGQGTYGQISIRQEWKEF